VGSHRSLAPVRPHCARQSTIASTAVATLDSSFVGEDATDLIDYVSYRARAVLGQDLAGSVPDLTVAHALIGRSHCAAFLRRLTFETGNRS